jgi:hypothetical protein
MIMMMMMMMMMMMTLGVCNNLELHSNADVGAVHTHKQTSKSVINAK